MRHANVTVCERLDGEVEVLYKGQSLEFKTRVQETKGSLVIDEKGINALVDGFVCLSQTNNATNSRQTSKNNWRIGI
ncbi:MAG: hypothetical protein LBQ43_00720 [Holosporales bacterium]|nr:hypothetical protein [Holosporales bacterium]